MAAPAGCRLRGEEPVFNTILLAIDLNEESSWRRALPAAVAQCRASGGSLHIVVVVPDFGMSIVAQHFPKDFEGRALQAARTAMQAFIAKEVPADLSPQSIVAHGTIYREILRTARAIGADLIVMASHRPELKDYLLGPNTARVVRHFERSVLVVRD